MDASARYVEIAIQQAMRCGDFDALPGTGTPLAGLTEVNDPDWWIRRKTDRENLTGLGPPALTLRTEDAGLDARRGCRGAGLGGTPPSPVAGARRGAPRRCRGTRRPQPS